jgi:transposase-like protein
MEKQAMKMTAKIWEQHVGAARQQKVSTKTYANQHGLSPSTLYYWQQKLHATANVRGVERQIGPSKHTSKFVALRVAQVAPVSTQRPSHYTLTLAPGIRLEMSALPDPQWLAALGRAAQGAL